jgi:hypothetical protein
MGRPAYWKRIAHQLGEVPVVLQPQPFRMWAPPRHPAFGIDVEETPLPSPTPPLPGAEDSAPPLPGENRSTGFETLNRSSAPLTAVSQHPVEKNTESRFEQISTPPYNIAAARGLPPIPVVAVSDLSPKKMAPVRNGRVFWAEDAATALERNGEARENPKREIAIGHALPDSSGPAVAGFFDISPPALAPVKLPSNTQPLRLPSESPAALLRDDHSAPPHKRDGQQPSAAKSAKATPVQSDEPPFATRTAWAERVEHVHTGVHIGTVEIRITPPPPLQPQPVPPPPARPPSASIISRGFTSSFGLSQS